MFIDYLSLIIINMVAGLALLADYLRKGQDQEDQRPYAAAFGGTGLLALILGLNLSLTWPLPGNHNILFGETTTLFGAVFLMTGYALSQGWNLFPVSIFAFFAGIDAFLMGLNILFSKTSQEPLISVLGFLLIGLLGIFSAPYLMYFQNKNIFRWVAIGSLLITAAIWLLIFGGELWSHLDNFVIWIPQ